MVVGCNFFEGDQQGSPPALRPGDTAPLSLGGVVTQAHPPPPISGGTLTIAPDGVTAVASDPDRDLVYIVDLAAGAVSRTIALSQDDEPGRVAIAAGRAHVALRGASALLSIDLATGATMRRATCIAPRGVAVEVAGTVLVACAAGQIERFPANGGDAVARAFVEHDLRDVIARSDGTIFVSTFRHAELLTLGADLRKTSSRLVERDTDLAWRTFDVADSAGGRATIMISQRPNPTPPLPGQTLSSYGDSNGATKDPCGTVPAHVDVLSASLGHTSFDLRAVLPVDAASDDVSLVVLSAGNGHAAGAPQLFILSRAPSTLPGQPVDPYPGSGCSPADPEHTVTTSGQPIAVAIDGAGDVIVQSREPAALYVLGPERVHVTRTIHLSDVSREDTGHAIFHSNSGANIACASCHAEGGEDAHTWPFPDFQKPLRTPSLRGTVAGTAPYHWDGSQKDIADIMNNVFTTAMSGPQLGSAQIDAVNKWVSAIPAPPPMAGATAASARGEAVFTAHGCIGCHSGAKHTNNQTIDVGSGTAFQVPPLVGVAWRAPYQHDGSSSTLQDRFVNAYGPHAGLTSAEITDLVAFLETL
jgi:hypothetical protein